MKTWRGGVRSLSCVSFRNISFGIYFGCVFKAKPSVFGTDVAVVFPELRELATGELRQSFLMHAKKIPSMYQVLEVLTT